MPDPKFLFNITHTSNLWSSEHFRQFSNLTPHPYKTIILEEIGYFLIFSNLSITLLFLSPIYQYIAHLPSNKEGVASPPLWWVPQITASSSPSRPCGASALLGWAALQRRSGRQLRVRGRGPDLAAAMATWLQAAAALLLGRKHAGAHELPGRYLSVAGVGGCRSQALAGQSPLLLPASRSQVGTGPRWRARRGHERSSSGHASFFRSFLRRNRACSLSLSHQRTGKKNK